MIQTEAHDLSEIESVLLTIYSVVFWVVLIWWFMRSTRPQKGRTTGIQFMPVIFIPIIYAWHTLFVPPLMWLGMLASRRRSKLISRFLERADDLRMRDEPIDQLLPRRPGSDGPTGKGGVAS